MYKRRARLRPSLNQHLPTGTLILSLGKYHIQKILSLSMKFFFSNFDLDRVIFCCFGWVRGQPPLELEKFPPKIPKFSTFFSPGKKILADWVKK